MIGKLDFYFPPTAKTEQVFCDKINELIDAVNSLRDDCNLLMGYIAPENGCAKNAHKSDLEEALEGFPGLFKSNKDEPLVDAVMQEVNDYTTGTSHLVSKKNLTTDPYAEQRKCLCKLCWFWNDDETSKVIGILTGVFDEADRPFERNINQTLYKHCEPVKPDDDIIYKGGKNE